MDRGRADAELHLGLNVETLALILSTVPQIQKAHVVWSGACVLLNVFEVLFDDRIKESLHDVE